jgi:hypothetical protein
MVSSALLAGGVFSAGLNASTIFVLGLLLVITALLSSGRAFSAFAAGAIDQHLFKKSLTHASAADILIILQSEVNNAAFRGIKGWNGPGFPAFLDLGGKLQAKLLELFIAGHPEISGIKGDYYLFAIFFADYFAQQILQAVKYFPVLFYNFIDILTLNLRSDILLIAGHRNLGRIVHPLQDSDQGSL